MNWLLLVVIIVVLGFAYNGYRKGLVSMILSVGTLIFSIIITGFLGPIFNESLCGSQIIMGYVSEQVNENLAIEQTMNNAIDELDRALSDSILTESEKASLREHLNIIEREMNDIVAQVAAIRKASELKNTAELAELNLRESEYLASYDGFVARLQQAISRITKGE